MTPYGVMVFHAYTHKNYMEYLILGVNTLYMLLCFSKLSLWALKNKGILQF